MYAAAGVEPPMLSNEHSPTDVLEAYINDTSLLEVAGNPKSVDPEISTKLQEIEELKAAFSVVEAAIKQKVDATEDIKCRFKEN
jgi:hypothetical protein